MDSNRKELMSFSSAELLNSLLYERRDEPCVTADFAIALRSGAERSHNYKSVPKCVVDAGLAETYLAMQEQGDGFSITVNEYEKENSEE